VNPTTVFQTDGLLTTHTPIYRIQLHMTAHKHSCSHHYDTIHITTVTVSYFNMF